MSQLSVLQYRGFASDRRMSMDIYADSLTSALGSTDLQVSSFKPESPLEKYATSTYLMRYLRYWHYPQTVRETKADIHHVLDHGYAHLYPKLSGGKSCVTVHDLIPLLNWKGAFKTIDGDKVIRRPWLNMKSLSYLKFFDRIVAISQSTKADLIEHLALPATKIEVIPPVISSCFRPIDSVLVDEFASKYQLNPNCRWIMISGREFYKNHSASLKVLKHLCDVSDYDFRLIKTGLESTEFDALVDQFELSCKVTQLFLDDAEELALLYNFVDCLLFPSFYEGFGMPVAEALACGTPVVSSDQASLPEVGGVLAQRAKPDDIEGLTKAVMTSVEDMQYRKTVKLESGQWVRQFRADTIAQKYERLYLNLASNY